MLRPSSADPKVAVSPVEVSGGSVDHNAAILRQIPETLRHLHKTQLNVALNTATPFRCLCQTQVSLIRSACQRSFKIPPPAVIENSPTPG